MNSSFIYKYITCALLTLSFVAFAETNYEPNNTFDTARPVIVNDPAQVHKFDYAGDEDWLVFYAQESIPYDIKIEVDSDGQGINPALSLYDENGGLKAEFDFNFLGEGELLSWNAPVSGFYFIKVSNQAAQFSTDAHYKVLVYLPFAPQNGKIKGKVLDQCTQRGIARAALITDVRQVFSHFRGEFIGEYNIVLTPREYTVNARAEGYQEQFLTAVVEEVTITPLEFQLMPEGGCIPQPDPVPLTVAEIELLQEQSVAVFDEASGILTIKDIRVGAEVIAASLKKRPDFSFELISTSALASGVFSHPAFYDYDTLLADIPQVFAFDELYAVSLKKRSNEWVYEIERANPIVALEPITRAPVLR